MSILSLLKRPKKAAKSRSPDAPPPVAAAPKAEPVKRAPPKPLAIAYPFYRYPEGRVPADRSAL